MTTTTVYVVSPDYAHVVSQSVKRNGRDSYRTRCGMTIDGGMPSTVIAPDSICPLCSKSDQALAPIKEILVDKMPKTFTAD